MGKISRTQLNSRLEALEIRISGLEPLTAEEKKELDTALELFNKTGKFTKNEYGDFLKRFEQEF